MTDQTPGACPAGHPALPVQRYLTRDERYAYRIECAHHAQCWEIRGCESPEAAIAAWNARTDDWRSLSMCALAAENQSAKDYMQHWEGRVAAAESENARLKGELAKVETALTAFHANAPGLPIMLNIESLLANLSALGGERETLEAEVSRLKGELLTGRATVGGEHCERSLEGLARACEVLLAEEQEKLEPNTALVGVLCDAVRMTREYGRSRGLAAIEIDRLKAEVGRLEGERDTATNVWRRVFDAEQEDFGAQAARLSDALLVIGALGIWRCANNGIRVEQTTIYREAIVAAFERLGGGK